jgi:pilus assembly protein CpaB
VLKSRDSGSPRRSVMWKVKRMKAARLVVLVVAIAAGGLAAFLASGSGDKPAQAPVQAKLGTVKVLVAQQDLSTGQKVAPDNLKWQTWPAAAAGPNFIRKADRPDAIKQLSGTFVRTAFAVDEPIRESKLIKADGSGYMAAILPSGMRAISTNISPETSAGGFILPNDRVDVILTRRDKAAEKAAGVEVHTSETILNNIRVLAIDQTIEEKNGQKVVVGKTATLELSQHQAETLALARQLGTLSLALRSLVDANKPKTNDDDGGKRASVNMVRFGVTTTARTK